jgi:uncharacterized protein (DUF433 family)
VSAEPIPLVIDSDGIVHIGTSRVTIDALVTAFHDGAISKEIVQQHPSLQLANVYAVVCYYPRHQREVEAYLGERQQHSDTVRQEHEACLDLLGMRERLLARPKLPR